MYLIVTWNSHLSSNLWFFFVGIVHIFMFSFILLSRYSQFCELCWINFSFRLKEEKGEATSVSLSEAYALSEWHSLSEAHALRKWHSLSETHNSLSVLGNPRRGSVRKIRTQRAVNSPSELFVPSRAQRAQLTKSEFINSCLASKSR